MGHLEKHIEAAEQKTEVTVAALARIIPNSSIRVVLGGVAHYILLYGASVWYEIVRIKRYKNMVKGLQRKLLLRIASAYRTISTVALQALTAMVPIDLLVLTAFHF